MTNHILDLLVLLRLVIIVRRVIGDDVHLAAAVFREEVDSSKLDDGGQHEGETDPDEVVEGRGVGDLGQVPPVIDAQEGHGQHVRDACSGEYKVT